MKGSKTEAGSDSAADSNFGIFFSLDEMTDD
jgi:hypothetical protein